MGERHSYVQPNEAFLILRRWSRYLLAKPSIGFGVVKVKDNLVVGFEEKPILDFLVSAGHYVLKREITYY